jgi:hypothetical protein
VIDPFQIAAANTDAVLRRFEEAIAALPEAKAALIEEIKQRIEPRRRRPRVRR